MFKSPNYTQVRCLECGAITQIVPDKPFEKLECLCDIKKEQANDDSGTSTKTIRKSKNDQK